MLLKKENSAGKMAQSNDSETIDSALSRKISDEFEICDQNIVKVENPSPSNLIGTPPTLVGDPKVAYGQTYLQLPFAVPKSSNRRRHSWFCG